MCPSGTELAPQPSAPPEGAGPLLPGAGGASRPLREQVFEHVRATGHANRTDITRALRISPGSATALTAGLIADGFLREVEGLPRDAGRGRPPVALEVVPDAAHVAGIRIGDDRLSAVLTDISGRTLAELHRPLAPRRRPLAQLIDDLDALLTDLLHKEGMALGALSEVGLGLSGIVDNTSGTVAWSPGLEGRDLPLRDALASRLGLSVQVDNDANVLTLAELWFGAGRENSDFAVVTIEEGVGMGLVLGSRLFRGSQGMGLELGHTKVHLDGALCRCGRRGCLEAYIAHYALAREAATALDRHARNLQSAEAMLESLYAQAKSGNNAAASIFRRAGRYLALGLSNIVQLFDPALIILSGDRMRYDYLYAEDVLAEMAAMSLSEGRAPPRVEIHGWDDTVWARGAAALALSAATPRILGAPA
ncbi:ROK family protein [Roseisalinus antarcticus]|uniref:N-acetylglucosamine repressor n=1 Tax=Roseisalinus antarcticus TaxID=254357 RepID=A0A1Y5TYN5_9RHOB|nr:ROK family protein [Roseisalinus antarcticus]SLN76655.1 N-acetylglucosamine repressor [Roseisalinus antarcticus]